MPCLMGSTAWSIVSSSQLSTLRCIMVGYAIIASSAFLFLSIRGPSPRDAPFVSRALSFLCVFIKVLFLLFHVSHDHPSYNVKKDVDYDFFFSFSPLLDLSLPFFSPSSSSSLSSFFSSFCRFL
jgi:hypothetical protein